MGEMTEAGMYVLRSPGGNTPFVLLINPEGNGILIARLPHLARRIVQKMEPEDVRDFEKVCGRMGYTYKRANLGTVLWESLLALWCVRSTVPKTG